MNMVTRVKILTILVLGIIVAGCGSSDSPTSSEPAESSGIPPVFDVDDVPSLNLPVEDREPGKLWCTEHSRYEEECYICHPELIPKASVEIDVDDVPSLNLPADQREPGRLWCKEHSRYEDECYICHPELEPNAKPTADEYRVEPTAKMDIQEDVISSAQNVLMCNEHRVAEAECGICQSDRLAELPVGEGMKIRFPSNLSTTKAGVTTGRPTQSATSTSVELLGEITFNENQLAMVTPLGGGVITEVLKDVGDEVVAGEVLAVVHSRDIAAARSEYTKALAESKRAKLTLAREQDLYEKKISPRKDLEQAQAAAAVADATVIVSRQYLYNLGLSEKDIVDTAPHGKDVSALPVRAPFSGTVIKRSAVIGTAVAPGDGLFAVADLSTMWMELSIAESQLSSVRLGSLVQARFDVYTGISFEGEIAWISPTISPDSRMLQARVVLANPQGLLKEGLFGRASLSGFAERNALSVSAGAVQEIDGKAVVFRKLEDDLYETRLISTSVAHDGNILVMAGLAPEDEIVTSGSYIVKSEFLKARLGAGCTDD